MMHVHTLARDACIALPSDSEFHKDNQMLQSYSFICGVVSFLNSKSMLELEVKVERGKDDE